MLALVGVASAHASLYTQTFPLYAPGLGLSVTLQHGGSGGSINTASEAPGQVLTGTYSAAGSLSGFNGSAVDGTWTLFFADEVSGGGQATLTGWSLDLTAVPEPANVAMVIFGVGFAGVGPFVVPQLMSFIPD